MKNTAFFLIALTTCATIARGQVTLLDRIEAPLDWEHEGTGLSVDIEGGFAVSTSFAGTTLMIGKCICYEKCSNGWIPVGEIDRSFHSTATVTIGDDYIAILNDASVSPEGIWIYDRTTFAYVTYLPELDVIDHGVSFIGNKLFVSSTIPATALLVYDGDNSWNVTSVDSNVGYITNFSDRLFVSNVGGVTEYREALGVWSLFSTITNLDPSMTRFGHEMTVTDGVLALRDGDVTSSFVDIYEWDGVSAWVLMDQISCASVNTFSYDAMAMNSDILLFREDDGSYQYDSWVRVFRRTGPDWSSTTEEDELYPTPLTGFDFFGDDIAIDGDDVIIGAMYNGTEIPGYSGHFAGSSYFYEDVPETAMQLLLYADGTSSATTWAITDATGATFVSGPSTAYAGACALRTESFDLPAGKYGLRISDADNTVCAGGFVLQTSTGQRVLDALMVPAFTSPSEWTADYTNPIRGFDIPVGTTTLTSHCDASTSRSTWLEVSEDCQVRFNCDNSIDDATTGYDFFWIQPHGPGRFLGSIRNNSTMSGSPGMGCDAARFVRASPLVTSPVPLSTHLNFRARAVVSNVPKAWGPVCRLYYSSARPGRFQVSPNPVPSGYKDLSVLKRTETGVVDMDDEGYMLEGWMIMDFSGRIVEKKQGLNLSISMDRLPLQLEKDLSPGIYLVQLQTTYGRETVKILAE